jgi:Transcriptional regulator, AbiEi antitoxin
VHPVLRAAADRRYGVFTAAEAVAAGHGHSEIQNLTRSGRWVRLRRGVLIAADDLDRARRDGLAHRVACLAVLLALDRPRTAVSHASAAQLWGLPVPRSAAGPIRLTDPDRWRGGEGYVMSRAPLRAGEAWRIRPVRAISAARTLVDCAREWQLEDAVVAMDAALLADRTTPDELGAAAAAVRHWQSAAGAARAAALADGRAESPLESRGRLRIVGAGFTTPELQVEIRSAGRLVGVVDAWFDEPAVAVEFDGRIKYADPWRGRSPERVLWEEKRREDELRGLDIQVLRIADADLGARWTDVEARLRRLLSTPGPASRRFTARARVVGLRRTG